MALARALARLAQAAGRSYRLELVGQSVGALALLPLLDRLAAARCSLLAPACTLDDARGTLAAALAAGRLPAAGLDLHVPSARREAAERFGAGGYGGSWLQFISRALSRWHRAPLAGLADAYDAGCATAERWHPATLDAVRDWQAWWADASAAGARLHHIDTDPAEPLAADPGRLHTEPHRAPR